MVCEWLREFVCVQKCLPWKVRLLVRRMVPWRVRRVLTRGRVNLNTPEAMDKRYSEQGDDFCSMENLYREILGHIPDAGKILDAGCGIGVLMREIRSVRPNAQLYGADFSPVAVARCRGYGFVAERAVLPDLPFPDSLFDVVVCTEVLEHLDDPLASVRSFHRVLKPGGMVIVSVPFGMGPDDCSEHVQDFTDELLRDCLTGGGFDIRDLRRVIREPARSPGASFLAVGVRSNAKHCP